MLSHLRTSVREQKRAEITPTKITKGSAYLSDEDSLSFAAEHAIDKDLSTIALAVAVGKEDNGPGWLKLEFDRTYFIHKVLIYYMFYTNWYDPGHWCAQTAIRFRDCVNIDNNVDVSVYQGEVKQGSCGTLQLTYGLEQADQIYTLVCDTEGDTVTLSKSKGHIGVYEVAVQRGGTVVL